MIKDHQDCLTQTWYTLVCSDAAALLSSSGTSCFMITRYLIFSQVLTKHEKLSKLKKEQEFLERLEQVQLAEE